MRVVVVSENISLRMGGEASLGLYYFKLLRARGAEVISICHARVRDELDATLSRDEIQQFRFVEDTALQYGVWRLGSLLPPRVRDLVFGQIIHTLTMRRIRKVVKELAAAWPDSICLEPSPITPRGVSFMYGLGIPVVIGPLCGGIDFPPAFRHMDNVLTRISISALRLLSGTLNRMIPGKRQADAIIVANRCTMRALPAVCKGKIYEVVESGVDLSIWATKRQEARDVAATVRFVFSGRLVDWKGVKLLVEAFRYVPTTTDARLEIVGSGELMPDIECATRDLRSAGRVVLHGWRSRPEAAEIISDCDVFVMPSLRECGGTAILEAMALGLPVIATDWAGPGNYVTPDTGILVDPHSHSEFVHGLTEAMLRLAVSPELRTRMGLAAVKRVKECYFDWDSKADRIMQILKEVRSEGSASTAIR